jgi:hypothetical protein
VPGALAEKVALWTVHAAPLRAQASVVPVADRLVLVLVLVQQYSPAGPAAAAEVVAKPVAGARAG